MRRFIKQQKSSRAPSPQKKISLLFSQIRCHQGGEQSIVLKDSADSYIDLTIKPQSEKLG